MPGEYMMTARGPLDVGLRVRRGATVSCIALSIMYHPDTPAMIASTIAPIISGLNIFVRVGK